MSSKKYYLTPNEFSVISAGFEIPMIYGLKQIDGRVDEKEICMALHNMYVNQLISNNDSKEFVADDELTEIMRVIKNSRSFISIDLSISDKMNTICCYCSKKCVVIEESFQNPGKLVLYFDDWKKICADTVRLAVDTSVIITLIDAKNGQGIKKTTILPNEEVDKEEVLNRYYKEVTDL